MAADAAKQVSGRETVTPRSTIVFLMAVILTAFFVPAAQGHDLQCFMQESSSVVQPPQYLRGYGLTDDGLVRLSVDGDGVFLITMAPAGKPLICVFALGKHWEWAPEPLQIKQDAGNND